ncbi:MAG: Fe-S cluster assembly protein HesB [Candidatus Thorarchaeota archaeon]
MNKAISPKRINDFQNKVFEWWSSNKREFPWRETTNPYYIMVSEIMLQQTQTSRVTNKFLEFIKKYPTPEVLVKAKKSDLLSTWSGLGYNRRALWLQEAAKQIIENKSFPQTVKELQELKGVGKYTARSILIFAFNSDLATVDTNIRRILIAEGFASEETNERELFEIAEKMVPKGKARDWANALMDYGAMKLTASKTGIKPISKQGKFTGSDRQYRGKILKILVNKKKITLDKLQDEIDLHEKKLDEILQKMIKEGLVANKGKQYFIDE